jgi:membrane protein
MLKALVRSIRQAIRQMDLTMILRRSAALAYYAALSLAPLIVIAVAVAGLIFQKDALRATLIAEVAALIGADGARLIAGILESSQQKDQALLATILGTATLLFGATAVFVELQDGLNAIWNIERRKGRGLWTFIRTRFLSVAMVISTGFLLLISLIVSTALSSLTKLLHVEEVAIIGLVVSFVVSVLVTGLFFATLFKFLPDARIRWREVVAGSVITAILFNLGQIAIGQYLGRASVGSAYGAAGSLVIVLVWVYYSSAVFFIGAEITQAYASLFGEAIAAREQKRGRG